MKPRQPAKDWLVIDKNLQGIAASQAVLVPAPSPGVARPLPAPVPRPEPHLIGPRLPITILGVPFDNITTQEAIAVIQRMVTSGKPHYLVTANIDFLVQAREDVELRRILFDAHLVLCDGTPLVWASRLLGNPLPERVAGADLVPLLIELAAREHYRLFFLGATPESAAQAVARLRAQHPNLLIAGHYSPPFAKLLEMDHDEIQARIRQARPDLLFVAFGCPKQEKWMAMHYRSLGVAVTVGVGATIDFLAGQVKRAPRWMQRSGTEWVFRLAQEPRRLFKRYRKDLTVFGFRFLAQYWHLQCRSFRTPPGPVVPALTSGKDFLLLPVPARLDLSAIEAGALPRAQILSEPRPCVLDVSGVEFIDSTGMGLLIHLHKQLRAQGRPLILLAPSARVQRALRLLHLQDFFHQAPDRETVQRQLQSLAAELTVLAPAQPGGPVRWRGEITAANAPEVWRHTEAQLGALPPEAHWQLDLSELRFLDSAGLGLMLRAKKLAQRQERRLTFTRLQPAVRNVVKLAGLEEFLLA